MFERQGRDASCAMRGFVKARAMVCCKWPLIDAEKPLPCGAVAVRGAGQAEVAPGAQSSSTPARSSCSSCRPLAPVLRRFLLLLLYCALVSRLISILPVWQWDLPWLPAGRPPGRRGAVCAPHRAAVPAVHSKFLNCAETPHTLIQVSRVHVGFGFRLLCKAVWKWE